MSDEKYESHVKAVLAECPDANPEEVAASFAKYENEFYIPPQDALRSVIRNFQSSKEAPSARAERQQQQPRVTKKVEKLSELSANDRDVEIEVEIISHNVREQMIRGEEKTIAFGLLEDNPWDENGERTRWEYKDWGSNSNLAPGSVVRLEGASVNEYQGRMSLNINQSTRVAVIREGTRPIVVPGEAIEINQLPSEGYVCVTGRVLATRPDQIVKRDGSGSIDIVRGRIADNSGAIDFLSWEPFEYAVGDLIKIENTQVRTFRDNPELNFGRTTKIEIYHDASVASVDELKANSVLTISQFKNGSRDIEAIVQVTELQQRSFTRDGEERFFWTGQVADPTGRCRMSAWQELPIDMGNLPVTIRVTGVRIREWQGIPDITVDTSGQVEVLDAAPWGEVDLSAHVAEVPLNELVNSSSRVGIATEGIVVSIREDSGLIRRCTECRRVLRDGFCANHDRNEGNEDLRFRLVIDDGLSTASLLLNKDASMALCGMTYDDIKDQITADGQADFVQGLRNKFLGRSIRSTGRSIVDEQGAMILGDGASKTDSDASLMVAEVRNKWGVN